MPGDARTALLREYSGLGWVTPRALERCPSADHIYYDQVAQIELPQWSRGRVTLVGDACHAVSLLAGQGAPLGMAGACILADQLQRSDSVEAALRRYERIWQPVITDRQRTVRETARWFVPDAAWQLHVRSGALTAPAPSGINRYRGAALAGESTSAATEPGIRKP